jgi:hypothetical protein
MLPTPISGPISRAQSHVLSGIRPSGVRKPVGLGANCPSTIRNCADHFIIYNLCRKLYHVYLEDVVSSEHVWSLMS